MHAATEGGLEAAGMPLPVQFFDTRYSYLDVDEALRIWAEGGGGGGENSYVGGGGWGVRGEEETGDGRGTGGDV